MSRGSGFLLLSLCRSFFSRPEIFCRRASGEGRRRRGGAQLGRRVLLRPRRNFFFPPPPAASLYFLSFCVTALHAAPRTAAGAAHGAHIAADGACSRGVRPQRLETAALGGEGSPAARIISNSFILSVRTECACRLWLSNKPSCVDLECSTTR